MITINCEGSGKFIIYGHPNQGKDFRLPKLKHNPKRKNERT